jgi:hypothetical protein
MPLAQKINRQAVVVIHGMGEQRPMETLRSFVKGVKAVLEASDPSEKRSTVRSKPDSIGNIYETVRLSMDSTRNRPITDFYEFYWAHNMRGTKFSQMLTWIFHLVFSSVSKVPPRLKKLWWTIWILFVVFVAGATILSVGNNLSNIKKIIAPLAAIFIFPVLLSAVGSFIKSVFLNSAGDAARYFTPEPDNISERSNIRQQGIQFLQKLHQIQTIEKVDRIIVVAHSLGTVVGYDLMRLLCTTYNEIYRPQLEIKQPLLEKLDAFLLTKDNLDEFRKLQFMTWDEQKVNGNPWLISDFVTLGAAINAADYFMVTQETFENLIIQREMPVCPPAKDTKDDSMIYNCWPPFEIEGQKRTIKLLNHGALFAVTRWTNIFYSCDYVGGPMQRKFKNGIKDVEIPRKSIWFYPGGHTDYWNIKDKQNALSEIIKAMCLNPDNGI